MSDNPPPPPPPFGNEPGASPPPAAPEPSGNIMSRLFDLSFTSFVTPSIIKIIFVVGVIFASITALFVFVAFAQNGGGAAVVGLIVAPFLWFFYVLLARVMCEIYLVVFRIEENTRSK